MRIAILGATSQIARDMIASLAVAGERNLHLFARRPSDIKKWLALIGLADRYPVDDFYTFGKHGFDAIINFVGAGNPEQIKALSPKVCGMVGQQEMLNELGGLTCL